MNFTDLLKIKEKWISLLKLCDGINDARKIRFRPLVLKLLKLISFFPERKVFPIRILLARLLPWDPLSLSISCPTSIFILTTRKDLDVLPYSLASAINNIALNGSRLTVVSPSECTSEVTGLLKKMRLETAVRAETDESLLEQFDLRRDYFPNGHSLMQVLKFLCVLSSRSAASIVLDGDTVFLRRRVWASEEKTVLVVPPEYQVSHLRFVRKYFPGLRQSCLGFTTQAQVMTKVWVEEMFTSVGGFDFVINSFTGAMRNFVSGTELDLFPCEWQLLGDWLTTYKKESIEISAYLNVSGNRSHYISSSNKNFSEEFLKSWLGNISEKFPSVASLSLHAYKTAL